MADEKTPPPKRIVYNNEKKRKENKTPYATRALKYKGKKYEVGDKMQMNGIEYDSAMKAGWIADDKPAKK